MYFVSFPVKLIVLFLKYFCRSKGILHYGRRKHVSSNRRCPNADHHHHSNNRNRHSLVLFSRRRDRLSHDSAGRLAPGTPRL